VGLLVAAAIGSATWASYRLAVEIGRDRSRAVGHVLARALADSHSSHLLAGRLEELRLSARRLTSNTEGESAPAVLTATFFDSDGRPLARSPDAGTATTLPATELAGGVDDGPAPGDGRRFVAPISFGIGETRRTIGAVEIVLADDFSARLKPRLTALYLLLGVAGSLLVAGLVYALSRWMLRTIPALTAAIEQVREGRFEAHVPETGGHELARLAGAFNDMSRRLALFGQYTSPAIIRALLQDPDLALPGGVTRHVTVVFADMRGFTRMSARRAPSDVLRVVNLYFCLLEQVVVDHGGHIDKLMGDAMMALFGLFDAPPPDLEQRFARNDCIPYARNAVQAMLHARDAVRVLNAFLARAADLPAFPPALVPCTFGCGIASGYATVGNIGGAHTKDYSVVGAIVNLAARLESQSRDGEVLVDSHTWRNLGGGALVRPRPPVELKGFEAPITPFEVRTLAADEAAGRRAFVEYAQRLFDEDFVAEAVLQSDPLASSADVQRFTAILRDALQAFALG
jgi:class 3 adenylate cyclase